MLVKSSTHNAARIFGVKMIRLHGYVSLEMKFVNFVNFSFFSFFFFFFLFFTSAKFSRNHRRFQHPSTYCILFSHTHTHPIMIQLLPRTHVTLGLRAVNSTRMLPLAFASRCRRRDFSNSAHQLAPPTKITSSTKVVDISNHPIIKKLPPFLHPYFANFLNFPVSHLTSFLVLHELTAVVPLFGLWSLFTHLDWPAASTITELLPPALVQSGEKYIDAMATRNSWTDLAGDNILRGALAYAVVKVLMPVRALLSVLATPWFAERVVIPVTRLLNRRKSTSAAGSADAKDPTVAEQLQHQQNKTKTKSEKEDSYISVNADPKGQVWNQEIPSELPHFKQKTSDPNKPSL